MRYTLSLFLSLVLLTTQFTWAQPNLNDILNGGGLIRGQRGGSDLQKVLQIGGLIYQVHKRSKRSHTRQPRQPQQRQPIYQPNPAPAPPTRELPRNNGVSKPSGYDYIAVGNQSMRLDPASLPLTINPGSSEHTQTVQKAVDLWNSAGLGTLFALTHGQADITVDWSGRGLSAGSRAETRMKTSSRVVVPVDIRVKQGGRSRYELARVMTHELGHVLGLDHSNQRSDIMYRSEGNGDLILSERDVRMVRWLYSQTDYVPVVGSTSSQSTSTASFQPTSFCGHDH